MYTLFGKADSVEPQGDGLYKAVIPMTSFPGIKISSVNTLKVVAMPESISITLVDSATTATGPKLLTRIFEAATSGGGGSKTESVNNVSIVTGAGGERWVVSTRKCTPPPPSKSPQRIKPAAAAATAHTPTSLHHPPIHPSTHPPAGWSRATSSCGSL